MKKLKENKEEQLNLGVVGISNMMEEVTAKMAQDINTKKETVIRQKLKEIVGIEINIEDEQLRRFKRLAIEYGQNKETIYFNDGSLNGIRLVTFVRKDIPFDYEKFTIGYEESYY